MSRWLICGYDQLHSDANLHNVVNIVYSNRPTNIKILNCSYWVLVGLDQEASLISICYSNMFCIWYIFAKDVYLLCHYVFSVQAKITRTKTNTEIKIYDIIITDSYDLVQNISYAELALVILHHVFFLK